LYGSECWALSRVDARKVDALDQWCLRRILDIRWYHRVSNCEMRRLTEQPSQVAFNKKAMTIALHINTHVRNKNKSKNKNYETQCPNDTQCPER